MKTLIFLLCCNKTKVQILEKKCRIYFKLWFDYFYAKLNKLL